MIYKPTTPRRVGRETAHGMGNYDPRHVGLYHWCDYWKHWDKVLKVDGMWVEVITCELQGNPLPGERVRRHCTAAHMAMFADRPFEITRD